MEEIIRQFHCRLCNYIKILKDDETISVCPACNNGENKVYKIKEAKPLFSQREWKIIVGVRDLFPEQHRKKYYEDK